MNERLVNNARFAARAINEATSFVLTTHLNHDADGIGSMLALYHVLIGLNKKVRMILNEPFSENITFLEGYAAIENCTGQSINCDLLIVLDIDCADLNRRGTRGSIIDYENMFCIDHHASNRCASALCLIDTTAAATGELLYDLIGLAKISINKVIADCLFVAISTDCGSFRYSNTTSKTMRIAAALLDKGVRPEISNEAIESKSFSNTIALAKILSTLEIFEEHIVVLTINNDLLLSLDEDSDNYVDYARKVTGCNAAVLFKEVKPGVIKLSLRFKYASAVIFSERYGGGGHDRAAGFSISGDLDRVKMKIIEELKDYLRQVDR